MNYETLIENLHQEAEYWRRLGGGSSATADKFEEAASAIETLIAEQKVMLEYLHYAGCDTCKHQLLGEFEYPCRCCKHSHGMDDNWQRRGTVKE